MVSFIRFPVVILLNVRILTVEVEMLYSEGNEILKTFQPNEFRTTGGKVLRKTLFFIFCWRGSAITP